MTHWRDVSVAFTDTKGKLFFPLKKVETLLLIEQKLRIFVCLDQVRGERCWGSWRKLWPVGALGVPGSGISLMLKSYMIFHIFNFAIFYKKKKKQKRDRFRFR